MVEELLAKRGLGLGCLCHHQQAACVLVYAMHQSHFWVVGVVAGIVLQMPCKCIYQCAAEVATPGMDYHAGWLVD